MTINARYVPKVLEPFKRGKTDVFVVIKKYKMFEELEKEFNVKDYPDELVIKLDSIEKKDQDSFNQNIDIPFGSYADISIMIDNAGKTKEERELKPLAQGEVTEFS